MLRIVDIGTDGRHLSARRGHLLVSEGGSEVGRVPLDDVAAVLLHAHSATLTASLMVALAERGAVIVACGDNHMPAAVVTPAVGHHLQTARMIAQADASAPLKKRLWQTLVASKIRQQALALEHVGASGLALRNMADRVKSGDPDNLEAQAARAYWPLLMGAGFRRDTAAEGTNALLNYGYAVLRALCARSVVAAGLNPALGVHHSNRQNAFALVDDIMEPFRPMVDLVVLQLARAGVNEVDVLAKSTLAKITNADVDIGDSVTPLNLVIDRVCRSVVDTFQDRGMRLHLPKAMRMMSACSV